MNFRELQKQTRLRIRRLMQTRFSAIMHRNEYNEFRGSICVTGLELIQSSPGSRGYMRQTGFAGLTPARISAGLGECLSNVTHAFLVNECTITIQSANTV